MSNKQATMICIRHPQQPSQHQTHLHLQSVAHSRSVSVADVHFRLVLLSTPAADVHTVRLPAIHPSAVTRMLRVIACVYLRHVITNSVYKGKFDSETLYTSTSIKGQSTAAVTLREQLCCRAMSENYRQQR